jgi:hypothetical protein
MENLDIDGFGYVYILSNPSVSGLKVGYTNNSVNERIVQLSSVTGVPTAFIPEEHNRFGINIGEFEDYKKGVMDKGLNRYYSSRSHVRANEHEITLISITKDRAQIIVSAKKMMSN